MEKNHIKTAPIVRRFRRIAAITIGAVVFLIFVGGLVRMTGSGMGCPDWPKCFGHIVPPTNEADVLWKANHSFREGIMIVYDSALWKAKSDLITGEEFLETNWEKFTVHDYAIYNPTHTWIEYINRLIGVLIGGFAILTLFFAFPIRKSHPRAFWFSVFGLLAIVIQGGVGAYVVRTNLEVGMISIHMFLALLILAMYVFGFVDTFKGALKKIPGIPIGGVIATVLVLGLTLTQILMGTQVRESIDHLAKTVGEGMRGSWIEMLEGTYDVHKLFYYVIVIAAVWMVYTWRNHLTNPAIRYLLITVGVAMLGEILLGIGMHNFGIPKILQPLHLLGATVLFAAEFALVSIGIFLFGNFKMSEGKHENFAFEKQD